MKYDYLVVGSGLYGAIFAHEANGLSSVRMRTAMICRRLSLAVSTAVSGSREMSHIIRLMMLRMVYFILNTRSWQMQKIM